MSQETWYVDIPSLACAYDEESSWIPMATFNSKQEALDYARITFGADEEGRIQLVTGG